MEELGERAWEGRGRKQYKQETRDPTTPAQNNNLTASERLIGADNPERKNKKKQQQQKKKKRRGEERERREDCKEAT
ncbi:hypothetical protein Dda_5468 [Drechslerella dactyloides]|uniref:Uncharacterized protein n=1 Tax=Drechslerella dactyloides TaxID=74499 RepID=A0AAD6NHK3_DREDA|nr:hypothetical protein Dda_5468 [Drechslerella dactyloides]